ncbi:MULTISPECIES: GNAT family N-acetyltransferase [Bacillus]|uniref:GNAT family N-acetyltransferase n=2 Tax=Bacillus cereus group TaxID=86661 RepID=A0A9X6UQS1_BACCE|nr:MULTISPECIES: GNAT family N-acetyltransferase [Bacillus]MCC6078441.1 GNAT family N-acetyltransferase [Bacillus thuringiensis]OTW78562.1 GNAT family N-acetyltransferase [Bacillus thuringiensis serovar sumiyoshiensis]PEB10691.1 GNAT family N-acetyltransferase [Bacillus thuringiensis]PEB55302.1 GNAT family N-acetyltransferase [Bacillus cereus]PEB67359.1 GNAT family N-acetyltransferase [Bacillus thuringiensis]
MEEFQFTKRVHKILEIAAKESECNIIHPVHLFIGMCKEGTGVCAELFMYLFHKVGPDFLEKLSLRKRFELHNQEYKKIGQYKLSYKAIEILQIAKKRMERFQQVVINEGHIMYALFRIDADIGEFIHTQMQEDILRITAVPRDLVVDLNRFKSIYNTLFCYIRRASPSDFDKLSRFVADEFGERWLQSVVYGFRTYNEKLPIYIAQQEEVIIGFACYDVVRGKKGLFGPMGIAKQNRVKGVGKELLHHCLYNMKQDGYEYAIIGQAGPIEFYERNCNARLIPIDNN